MWWCCCSIVYGVVGGSGMVGGGSGKERKGDGRTTPSVRPPMSRQHAAGGKGKGERTWRRTTGMVARKARMVTTAYMFWGPVCVCVCGKGREDGVSYYSYSSRTFFFGGGGGCSVGRQASMCTYEEIGGRGEARTELLGPGLLVGLLRHHVLERGRLLSSLSSPSPRGRAGK